MFLFLPMFWFVMLGERNCLPDLFLIMITLTSSPVLLTRMCLNGLDVFSNFSRPAGNQLTNNAVAAATRNEQRFVVASIVGGQASLGFWGNTSHAQMRHETSRNNDLPRMHQQIIGEVNSERVHAGSDESDLVEGRDDIERRHAAPRRRILNGVHHCNIHIGFSPERNNPSSRFHEIQRGYASLDLLTQAVVQSFASRAQGPPRQIIDDWFSS
jgi:hypothetical protein